MRIWILGVPVATGVGKKKWAKPELLVLVRGRPEESILAACKYALGTGTPSTAYFHCMETGSLSCDTDCSALGTS
jgi:hypothetical protein